MTRINISDLNSTGYQLFEDRESFLEELEETEMEAIVGGYFKINLSKISPLYQEIFTAQSLGVYNIKSSDLAGKSNSVYSNSVYSNSVYGNTVNNNTYNGKTSGNFNSVKP